MKKFFMFAMLVIAGAGAARAQGNSIVGKWTIVAFNGSGMSIDFNDEAGTKKAMAQKMKEQTGQTPDTAQINMIYNMVVPTLKNTVFEFTSGGKAIYQTTSPSGEKMSDTATYKLDAAKGTITTTAMVEGSQKTEVGKYRWEGSTLVLQQSDRDEVIKLKKMK